MSKTYEDYDAFKQEYQEDTSFSLSPSERFWILNQPWLASCGYMLRPRYRLGWVPSWQEPDKPKWKCEDGIGLWDGKLLDATRVSDGKVVMLKMIFRSKHPFEVEIGRYFSNGDLAAEPGNHCIPILEVLVIPDYKDLDIIVMPLLRRYNSPHFKSVGESMDFFRQIFEGLQFMHMHHIAHRDCSGPNILMDPTKIFPNGFHPMRESFNPNFVGRAKRYTRTERPPKYYLADFGLSRYYDPEAGPPLELPIHGTDRTVPEFQGEGYDQLSNPFATDVFYLGNEIKTTFLQHAFNLDFMSGLIADMTDDDPAQRPTMDQVVNRFDAIFHSLRASQLRARLVHPNELHPDNAFERWSRDVSHVFRRIKYVLFMYSPVPRGG